MGKQISVVFYFNAMKFPCRLCVDFVQSFFITVIPSFNDNSHQMSNGLHGHLSSLTSTIFPLLGALHQRPLLSLGMSSVESIALRDEHCTV
jgi:hypothetical protein